MQVVCGYRKSTAADLQTPSTDGWHSAHCRMRKSCAAVADPRESGICKFWFLYSLPNMSMQAVKSCLVGVPTRRRLRDPPQISSECSGIHCHQTELHPHRRTHLHGTLKNITAPPSTGLSIISSLTRRRATRAPIAGSVQAGIIRAGSKTPEQYHDREDARASNTGAVESRRGWSSVRCERFAASAPGSRRDKFGPFPLLKPLKRGRSRDREVWLWGRARFGGAMPSGPIALASRAARSLAYSLRLQLHLPARCRGGALVLTRRLACRGERRQ